LRDIKQVSKNEFRIDLDSRIDTKKVKVEYLRDIVQLSIRGLSVYPAKVVNPAQSEVSRVFAYQFTPELVRIRFTVPGKADAYKDSVILKGQGSTLRVRVNQPRIVKAKPAPKVKEKRNEDVVVVSAAQAVNPEPLSKEETELLSKEIPRPESLPSPIKAFGWMMGCILGFAGIVLLIRMIYLRISSSSWFSGSGKMGQILEKVAQSVPGRNKPIEVLSTKYLGPKRSLCVVKVKGRTLLIGATQESINLIADLTEDESNEELEELAQSPSLITNTNESMGAGATVAGPAVFAKYLQAESKLEEKPAPAISKNKSEKSVNPGIRDQIRRKVEGLKSL